MNNYCKEQCVCFFFQQQCSFTNLLWIVIIINYSTKYELFFRDLAPKLIFNCTPKYTWENRNPTNAATAANPSPTAPTSLNTWESILVSNPTDVRFVNESLHNYHIYNNIYGHIQGTNLTSAEYQVKFPSIFSDHVMKYSVLRKRKNILIDLLSYNIGQKQRKKVIVFILHHFFLSSY